MTAWFGSDTKNYSCSSANAHPFRCDSRVKQHVRLLAHVEELPLLQHNGLAIFRDAATKWMIPNPCRSISQTAQPSNDHDDITLVQDACHMQSTEKRCTWLYVGAVERSWLQPQPLFDLINVPTSRNGSFVEDCAPTLTAACSIRMAHCREWRAGKEKCIQRGVLPAAMASATVPRILSKI